MLIEELWPELLLQARSRLDAEATAHLADYGVPMTNMNRVHTLRSNAMGVFAKLDPAGYILEEQYRDFGKIVIGDVSTGQRYQLKSVQALKFELQRGIQLDVFGNTDRQLNVVLYQFDLQDYLHLACAPARFEQVRGRKSVRLVAEPTKWGVWGVDGGTNVAEAEGFDQGHEDAYDDLFGVERDDLTDNDDL